ncbi:hypothetical protein J6590_101222, partial [Homalodisca vitripennis]
MSNRELYKQLLDPLTKLCLRWFCWMYRILLAEAPAVVRTLGSWSGSMEYSPVKGDRGHSSREDLKDNVQN